MPDRACALSEGRTCEGSHCSTGPEAELKGEGELPADLQLKVVLPASESWHSKGSAAITAA